MHLAGMHFTLSEFFKRGKERCKAGGDVGRHAARLCLALRSQVPPLKKHPILRNFTFCWPCVMLWFLVHDQRDAQLFTVYLFSFLTLYMFRAHRAHQQERQTVSIQPLVTVTPCRWPCLVQVGSELTSDLHTTRPPTASTSSVSHVYQILLKSVGRFLCMFLLCVTCLTTLSVAAIVWRRRLWL
jgi:hypothetical protein